MAPHPDPDDERPAAGPPLPPEDRLWRHPSELGPLPRPSASPPDVALVAAGPARRTSTRGALTGACLAGALVTLGVLLLTRPAPDDLGRTVVLGRVATSVPTITSLTAPVAAAAHPIHSARDTSVDTPPRLHGRLLVEVTDGPDSAEVVAVELDGPAHRAGVLQGDRILAVEGRAVTSASDLVDALSDTDRGDLVEIEVRRGDVDLSLTAELR